ncbi:hypothetical protein D6779_08870, partial [Candidatus Parcubacteria bacterium]
MSKTTLLLRSLLFGIYCSAAINVVLGITAFLTLEPEKLAKFVDVQFKYSVPILLFLIFSI